MVKRVFRLPVLALCTLCVCVLFCCSEKENPVYVEPGVDLALDSITTTKKTIIVWEEILVTAHARGENLSYKWQTNHGSMIGKDSVTVRYWGCPSCEGYNTIECEVTNEFGTVTDTIMVQVNQGK